jgi:hypothetical protein
MNLLHPSRRPRPTQHRSPSRPTLPISCACLVGKWDPVLFFSSPRWSTPTCHIASTSSSLTRVCKPGQGTSPQPCSWHECRARRPRPRATRAFSPFPLKRDAPRAPPATAALPRRRPVTQQPIDTYPRPFYPCLVLHKPLIPQARPLLQGIAHLGIFPFGFSVHL